MSLADGQIDFGSRLTVIGSEQSLIRREHRCSVEQLARRKIRDLSPNTSSAGYLGGMLTRRERSTINAHRKRPIAINFRRRPQRRSHFRDGGISSGHRWGQEGVHLSCPSVPSLLELPRGRGSGAYQITQRRIVVWETANDRSAIMAITGPAAHHEDDRRSHFCAWHSRIAPGDIHQHRLLIRAHRWHHIPSRQSMDDATCAQRY